MHSDNIIGKRNDGSDPRPSRRDILLVSCRCSYIPKYMTVHSAQQGCLNEYNEYIENFPPAHLRGTLRRYCLVRGVFLDRTASLPVLYGRALASMRFAIWGPQGRFTLRSHCNFRGDRESAL